MDSATKKRRRGVAADSASYQGGSFRCGGSGGEGGFAGAVAGRSVVGALQVAYQPRRRQPNKKFNELTFLPGLRFSCKRARDPTTNNHVVAPSAFVFWFTHSQHKC